MKQENWASVCDCQYVVFIVRFAYMVGVPKINNICTEWTTDSMRKDRTTCTVICVVLLGRRRKAYTKVYLALVVMTTLSCYLLMRPSSTAHELTEHSVLKLPKFDPLSLDSLRYSLQRLADANKVIYVSLVDDAFVDVAMNLYLTSFKRLAIDNYLFVAMNAKCCAVLSSRGINCLQYLPEFKDGQKSSNYGHAAFNIKTNFRAKIVLDALRLGFNPFLVDLDIVFISNPLEIVLPLADKYDIIVQNDGDKKLNGGFYFGKPTPKLINFFTKCYNASLTPLAAKQHDQIVMKSILKKSPINVHYLEVKQFYVGRFYWDERRLSFNYKHPWINRAASKTPEVVVVHNNWLVSKEAKIYRFKESLMWLVDDDGYYSNSDEQYIMFDNPHMSKSEKGLQLEAKALLNALSIGYLLNRKVILPAFHCHKTRNTFCKANGQECSLMALYHVATFDAHFGGAYREHVFLSHDLVPDDVRVSMTEPFVIKTTDFRNLSRVNSAASDVHTLTPSNVTLGATPREIRQWFGGEKQSVLVFHNLYGGVFAGFGKSAEFADIRRRLKQALKPCNYRQLAYCKGSPKRYFKQPLI